MYLPMLALACASQGPPGGGPEDTTPPEVVSIFPSADSTGVGRRVTPLIVFSEPMDEASTEAAIFISPQPRRPPRLSWHKTSLEIVLRDSLPENVTCVITVGTAAKDLRNNSLKRAYTFAFATGDSIDRGKISGRMVTDQTAGVAVWAYRLGDEPDSIFLKRRADYITQVDREGRFVLAYLAPGRYRLFGIADIDENQRFTPAVDYIGLPSFEPVVEGRTGEVVAVNAMLSLHDTTAFRVVEAQTDGREIRISFSKALAAYRYSQDGLGSDSLRGRVRVAATGPEIIRDMWVDSKSESMIALLLERYRSDSLTVVLDGLISSSGDTLTATAIGVKRSELDTTTAIEIEFPPSQASVGPDFAAEMRFSGGMDRSSLVRQIFLLDSSGSRTDGDIRWKHSAHLTWRPSASLTGRMSYRLIVRLDSIMNWRGRIIGDSVRALPFSTYKADTLGTVRGQIDEEGDHAVQITRIGQPAFSRRQLLRGPVEFTFEYLLPGRYNVTGFRDDDGNGRYSFGRLSPWKPAETFLSYPDTVTVRSNWETTNVNLRFKKP